MAETLAEHFARIAANTRIANEEAEAKREADADAGIEPPPQREFRYALSPEQRRHAGGGNGGPPLVEPVALKPGSALVLGIGQHLFGDRHTTDLARACGEDPRAVRRWAAGEGNGPGKGATAFLRGEVERRIGKLREALEALDVFREERGWATAPAPPPPQPAPEVILAPGVKPEDAAWFIDHFACRDGRPTPIRVILSARRPPKGRHWTAEVVLFDWSRQMLHCDRTDDLQGAALGFASAAPGRPEPWIYWDDETNAWARGPDWGSSGMKAQLAEETGIPMQGGLL